MADTKTPETCYTSGEFKKDMKEILWENRIQTIAVALVFFFGVTTLMDISNRLKK